MAKYERITVRLSYDEVLSLRRLVDQGRYDNISQIASRAISDFLRSHASDDDHLPPEDDDMDDIVSGVPEDIDQMIKDAVRNYVKRHMDD